MTVESLIGRLMADAIAWRRDVALLSLIDGSPPPPLSLCGRASCFCIEKRGQSQAV